MCILTVYHFSCIKGAFILSVLPPLQRCLTFTRHFWDNIKPFVGLSVGPDTLASLSHLSQLMMMFPSARHMDSVVLSKSLFQSDPREYFRTVLQVPSFLSCALITLSPIAAVEIRLGI